MSRPAGRVLRQPDPSPLSESERQRAAAAFAEVKRLMPDMPAELKALHELGLIDGLRAIRYIGPVRERDPNAMTLDRICLESDFIAMQQPQKRGRA